MKRFLISSPQFTGDAEIIYDAADRLIRIDVSATNMPCNMVDKFKEKIPSNVIAITTVFAGTAATVVEAALQISFEQFWKEYNHKVKKIRAKEAWDKLSEADQVKAFYGIAAYDKFLKKGGWRSKVDADRYLKERYFENEYK
jgi:hypothetical protein